MGRKREQEKQQETKQEKKRGRSGKRDWSRKRGQKKVEREEKVKSVEDVNRKWFVKGRSKSVELLYQTKSNLLEAHNPLFIKTKTCIKARLPPQQDSSDPLFLRQITCQSTGILSPLNSPLQTPEFITRQFLFEIKALKASTGLNTISKKKENVMRPKLKTVQGSIQ
ncbi:unnamed protein product [Moneuplotes crassus]|uniref:Uncharacterized protein n=1 Tax=Euplotes crassus TaxID=5936 RepID=A0AAD1URM2_EUPCR|nr:unnamed protein product [Moneuplotes crassus]